MNILPFEAKATRRCHAAELRLPGHCAHVLLPRGSRSNGLGKLIYSLSGLSVSRLSISECDCYEFMAVRVCGARLNFNLFFVYRSSSTDDSIYDCLLESMGMIKSQNKKFAFCLVFGD